MNLSFHCRACGLGCAFMVLAAVCSAGPINPPPGPVTSTLKPLAEVEPRTAISDANTLGDGDSVFRITLPGAYYLTANVPGQLGKSGIEIAATNVTIDLMGFSLIGIAGSLDGIVAVSGSGPGLTIRNGVVSNWAGAGISVQTAAVRTSLIENVHARNNASAGIRGSAGAVIRSCTSYSNGGAGFDVGIASTVSDCAATFNTADGFGRPIGVATGSTFLRCTAFANTANGFLVDQGSTVQECSAYLNSVDGFVLGTGSLIRGCTASINAGDGVELGNKCVAMNNLCEGNGNNAGVGAGIHATGSDNRIDGNHCTTADVGVQVDVAGNIIVRNTCAGNMTDWQIAANNVYGPIIDRRAPASVAVNGFTATSTLGSADPHANFSY